MYYFDHEINTEVREIYWNTLLSNLSQNLAYIFEPIFLFGLGYNPIQILTFFLCVYLMYALLVIPITKITSQIGYKHAILLSTFAYVIYWFLLYQIKFHSGLFFVAPVIYALQKSSYWPPYNADVALNNGKGQRGREVGVLYSLGAICSIVGPIVGGLLSYAFGFKVLFFASSLLMLTSTYPLFLSPEIYTRHNFHLKNLVTIFRKYPRNFFAYWGYAEDLMLMTLWPLFIFITIPQLLSVGLIVTVASLVAVVLMLYLGRLLDVQRRLQLLPLGATFYGITWLFRFLAGSFGAVLGFDVATRIGKAAVSVPMETITYSLAGSAGPDHAIAYAVFYEFSLSIGKILTALAGIWILSSGGNITTVFVFAGAATFLYALLRK